MNICKNITKAGVSQGGPGETLKVILIELHSIFLGQLRSMTELTVKPLCEEKRGCYHLHILERDINRVCDQKWVF